MYAYYYIQTNAICILLLGGIGVTLHKKKGTHPAEEVALTHIIMATIIMCISDIFAWICQGVMLSGMNAVLHISNMVYYAATTAVCYAWLYYVDIRVFGIKAQQRRRVILSAIPMLVMFAVIFTNPLHGFLFRIDEQNIYTRGSGVVLHWIITWGYMAVGAARVGQRILRARTKAERRQYIPLLWFFVMPVLGALLQIFFYGITTIQCGITFSVILYAYVSLQAQISGDALTGLNNRRALEQYLDTQMQRAGTVLSVFMCDIDEFKKINDSLGHMCGDMALRRTAKALKAACGRCGCSAFLCRYGGDEFVICSTDMDEEKLSALEHAIGEELVRGNAEDPENVPLSLSIGTARGVCTDDIAAETLLREADEAMYRSKRAKGKGR